MNVDVRQLRREKGGVILLFCRFRLIGLLVLFLGNVQILYADALHDMFGKTLIEAEAGDRTSMYELGRMYELGVGTERNQQEAISWYEQAAAKGNGRAAFKLGKTYYEGKHVPKDFAKAHKWFLKAVDNGNAEARTYLATMYREGQGVAQDLVQAEKWSRPPGKPRAAEPQEAADTAEPVVTEEKKVARVEKKELAKVQEKPRKPAEIISEARWEKNDKPALYLPSEAAHCHQEKNDIVCISDELHGRQLNLSYTYRVISRLSRFDPKGKFELSYEFQLGGVVEDQLGGYDTGDEEETMKATAGSILEDLQKKESSLSCSLVKKNKLVCKNPRGQPLEFTAAR